MSLERNEFFQNIISWEFADMSVIDDISYLTVWLLYRIGYIDTIL